MIDESTIESILVADCGTVFTKLLLLERVADSYRFVAKSQVLTTMNSPWNDISEGVVQALGELEHIIGRTLKSGGHLISPREGLSGVDAFAVIMSGTDPLHVVLAGLVHEMSLESARRVASSTYASVDAVLSREGSLRSPEETWARAVRDCAPDVVLLVGGVDGGASRPIMELADAIALGTSMLEQSSRPQILYAGNAKLRAGVTKLLGDISKVEVVDNVRPSVDTEHLGPAQERLEELYIEKRLQEAPGVEALTAWSRLSPQPTATAFGRVVEYLWRREGVADRGVLGVDLGAANTTIASCVNGRLSVNVFARQGTVYGPLTWIEENGLEDLLRWLPEEITPDDVVSILYNRALRPWTMPQGLQELWVDQAIAREMLRNAVKSARAAWNAGFGGNTPFFDPIILSGGGIVHAPRPGQALLVALDGLEPLGISTILLDKDGTAPALGAVAAVKPLAAAAALASGALSPLGTVISPIGKARAGDPILQMQITYEDQSTLDVEARYGELEIWPLLPGQRATVEIRPLRRFDVGLGGPGKGGKIEAIGGFLGLIVDARGRPLSLPEDPERRRNHIQRWIWDVGG
ncbi:MAG: glutamate mutase L [Anaerolineae bacterium]|nr:glutamate mutase L [Anaerolineae bacterium]